MLKFLMWISIFAFLGTVIYDSGFFSTKLTHKSHHGGADLFMDAVLKNDLVAYEQHSRGSAQRMGSFICNAAHEGPSRIARFFVETGGSPGMGSRTSGRAFCYGSGGEMFLEVAFTIERFDQEWYVSEVGTRKMNGSGGN